MDDKNTGFGYTNEFIDEWKVQDNVNKKIKLLIAQEELRKQRDKERHIRLEKVKNDSFQKKLQKVRAELEYQEFVRKMKEREMELLRVESDKVDAEERMLEEIKVSALEALTQDKNDSLDAYDFTQDDSHDTDLEVEKLKLIENIRKKRLKLKAKEDEITRLVNITNLKDVY